MTLRCLTIFMYSYKLSTKKSFQNASDLIWKSQNIELIKTISDFFKSHKLQNTYHIYITITDVGMNEPP